MTTDPFVQRMRRLAVIAAITLLALTAMANANIFGEDTRHPQSREGAGRIYAPIMRLRSNYPVPMDPATLADVKSGKVKLYHDVMGTGFMVSPCYMLTNYHVVFGKTGGVGATDMVNYSVTAYTSDGDEALATPELKGPTDTGDLDDAEDWVLLRLHQCVGKNIGWMERGDFHAAAEHGSDYHIAGFPGDISGSDPKAQLIMSGGCALKVSAGFRDSNGQWHDEYNNSPPFPLDGSWGAFRHDCPMTHGASGAPIFYIDQSGVPRYVAINSSDMNGRIVAYQKWTSNTSNFAVALCCYRRKNFGGFDWAEMWRRIDADLKRFGKANPALKGFPAEVLTDPQGQIPAKLLTDPRF